MQACPRCHATYPDELTECPADGTTLLPSGMVPAEDAPIQPGTMIGEYRIERRLGSGTFGDVYAGEQPLIGKRVAIKLLHRKLSSDAEVVSRFVAEARAVNRIRHKHIIDIFSFGMQEGRHYFVMELLDGLTLGELLHRERRLSVERALPIFRGIAAGLDAAHEAGITHRDLKPDNVFLAAERDGSYFVKILDFGIAKLAGDDLAHRTATGMAMGTPRYMSPEQCRGKAVDSRADIYSLGVVIHEVLTGRPLYDGDSSMDVLFKHASEAPPRMSSVRPELPADLDEPVLAMLAKRPKQRPATAGEAVAELERRAKEHGHAATLPASSASRSTRKEGDPAKADGPDPAGDPAPRLGTDDPTVAVRQRKTPVSKPSPLAIDETRESQIETEIATAETLAVPSSGGALPSVEVRLSTEIAPVSKSETLRSPGPLDVAAGGAIARRPARAPRGAGFWAGLAGLGIGAAVTAIVVARSGGDRASGAAAQPSASAGATTSAIAEMVSVRVKVAPADAWLVIGDRRSRASDPLVLPRSSQSQALRVEREGYEPETVWVVPDRDTELSPIALTHAAAVVSVAPAGTQAPSGKPIAKPKLHDDLERPPELGRPR